MEKQAEKTTPTKKNKNKQKRTSMFFKEKFKKTPKNVKSIFTKAMN